MGRGGGVKRRKAGESVCWHAQHSSPPLPPPAAAATAPHAAGSSLPEHIGRLPGCATGWRLLLDRCRPPLRAMQGAWVGRLGCVGVGGLGALHAVVTTSSKMEQVTDCFRLHWGSLRGFSCTDGHEGVDCCSVPTHSCHAGTPSDRACKWLTLLYASLPSSCSSHLTWECHAIRPASMSARELVAPHGCAHMPTCGAILGAPAGTARMQPHDPAPHARAHLDTIPQLQANAVDGHWLVPLILLLLLHGWRTSPPGQRRSLSHVHVSLLVR